MTKCEFCNEEKNYLIVIKDDYETIKGKQIYFTKIYHPTVMCLECFVFDVTDGEKQIEE